MEKEDTISETITDRETPFRVEFDAVQPSCVIRPIEHGLVVLACVEDIDILLKTRHSASG